MMRILSLGLLLLAFSAQAARYHTVELKAFTDYSIELKSLPDEIRLVFWEPSQLKETPHAKITQEFLDAECHLLPTKSRTYKPRRSGGKARTRYTFRVSLSLGDDSSGCMVKLTSPSRQKAVEVNISVGD